jgi:hypothetical protein
MRAEIEASGDKPVGPRVPGGERQVEDRFGFGLGEPEPVGDAEMGAGDRLDAPRGEEAVLGLVDSLCVSEIAVTRFSPSARQAVKMLSVAVVAGAPAICRISPRRCWSKTWPWTMLEAVQP